jgi:hypothetical protein
MIQNQRAYYLDLRRRFEPPSATLVIIAESPPISGKFFYDPNGKVSEPLFSALMKHLGIQPKTKLEGLDGFQHQGWVLIDSTYEPVNELVPAARDRVIERDYAELRDDLRRLLAARWNQVPLVLIKANVCKLLAPKLEKDEFKVLNKDRIIPFPSNGQQGAFDRLFREIVPKPLHGGGG